MKMMMMTMTTIILMVMLKRIIIIMKDDDDNGDEDYRLVESGCGLHCEMVKWSMALRHRHA